MRHSESTSAYWSLFYETNWLLAKEGNYINVDLGDRSSAGDHICELKHYRPSGSYAADGIYYQSYFHSWQWETGITPNGGINAPTPVSGVYKDGTLITTGHATSGYKVDWRHGRVIFNTAQATGYTLSGNFPAQEIVVHAPDRNTEIVKRANWFNSPEAFVRPTVADPTKLPYPLVVVTEAERQERIAGFGGETEKKHRYFLDVYAFKRGIVDSVCDVMIEKITNTVPKVDFTQSSAWPLLWDGTLNPSYSGWDTVRNSLVQEHMYVDDATVRTPFPKDGEYTARIVLELTWQDS